jgi:hypothetical protein
MSSRFSSGGLRRTAIALALLGALALVGGPALAQPGPDAASAGPLPGLFDWLHDLLRDLGWEPGPGEAPQEPEGPRPAFLPDGMCIDPNGNQVPCPESESSTSEVLSLVPNPINQ